MGKVGFHLLSGHLQTSSLFSSTEPSKSGTSFIPSHQSSTSPPPQWPSFNCTLDSQPLIWLCSVYAGTRKASRKNQKMLTNQRKGRKANPPKEKKAKLGHKTMSILPNAHLDDLFGKSFSHTQVQLRSLLLRTLISRLLPGTQEFDSSAISLSGSSSPAPNSPLGTNKLLRPRLSLLRTQLLPSELALPAASSPKHPALQTLFRPLFSWDPRRLALTQVVLAAQVQLLFVGHPLQVHSGARARSFRGSEGQDTEMQGSRKSTPLLRQNKDKFKGGFAESRAPPPPPAS